MPEIAIIADSSPLIGLARIGQLDLLRKVSARVIVPQAVWVEVTLFPDLPGAAEISRCTWIDVVTPKPELFTQFISLVDRGEAEAIGLALSMPGCLLLMDDALGRRVATKFQIKLTGTVGLLLRSWKLGLIPRLRPCLEALQANGIYIRTELINEALKETGEL